jgi:hypothetical protein
MTTIFSIYSFVLALALWQEFQNAHPKKLVADAE